ncbi:MAG: potassium channel family protein [Pyrinomonadaceae bacterium]
MRLLAIIPGMALILVILWDAFETIILPRRVTRRLRLTSVFYLTMWSICSGLVRAMRNRKRREEYLGTFGPLSLLLLLALSALGLILGYAMLLWAVDKPLNISAADTNFGTYLYLSGVTFFTLGYGDVAPLLPLGRALVVVERIREILAKNGTRLHDGEGAEQRLDELRLMYEPYVCALSEMLLMPLSPWILGNDAIDNWKTSAWGRIQ